MMATRGFHDLYVMREKVGDGAFGIVFRAHEVQTGVDVAVKRLSKPMNWGKCLDLNEVQCLTMLRHPNVINVRHACI